ncbi:TPA: class I SAM-dependent methyltransferase [Candidatus Poribacteria bacterium]|nr:class I SAM-dependent methyltransferase [Candidatus Poribacteria bacterium]HEX28845.1 class I SAM-dependent methyltransferase [Candidatus Poribacteria bacterium]
MKGRWYLKVLIQKFLSLMPYGCALNFLLQRRYGELKEISVADKLEEIVRTFVVPILRRQGTIAGVKVVEIGTGWVPILPITLSLLGARCETFDIAKHLKTEIVIRTLAEMRRHLVILTEISGFSLRDAERKLERALGRSKVEDIMETLGIYYLAPADTTDLPVASDSRDVTVSRLVLAHIPPGILPAVLKELYRITRPGGLSIHRVNLHDEYAASDPKATSINFLRYPGWFWDRFVNNRIKYLNRARYPYYLDLFEKTGFRIVSLDRTLDKRSYNALSSMRVAREFRGYSREELATIKFTVILEKPR